MSIEFGPVHSLPPEELEAASLLDTKLRVWAEIGRTQLPAATVVGMSEGVILDLDRESDEPADLYVNGRHFGTGRLILVDGEWALRIEAIDDDGVAGAADEADGDGDEPDAVEQPSSRGQDELDPDD